MKVHENFKRYAIDPDGDVFEIATGEKVEYNKAGEVRLVSEEIFVSELNGRQSNLVRRLKREQVIKYYQAGVPFEVKEKVEQPKDNPSVVEPTKEQSTAPKKDSGAFKFDIEGVKYENASQAGKALGVSSTTINNRVKSNKPEFADYKAI